MGNLCYFAKYDLKLKEPKLVKITKITLERKVNTRGPMKYIQKLDRVGRLLVGQIIRFNKDEINEAIALTAQVITDMKKEVKK